ncbi:MAG TPA: proton-conducting transporter membrane subunit [Anaerolineales bacterium]|nr:proton-conducting transporter membrane subunit [Anaerolineales bacterium]HMV94663.1 proton-conducting transporter membrane subunit [Anaerolineales bacterium]HMX19610.1 proton-conducting transporter membrane subunit [Anaerolineales bacterium]HMX74006.1 proton-conducting transporter membrane subunit [Anaerolineales bacterium]HMZ43138.1 proton-conducting transporter membrane subunit [Anaerolineales bacterium]
MNILNFVSMITIPLIATPMVYLSGRLGTRETVLHSRSYLVRGLALLAILLAWIPFVVSARAFLAGGVLEFSIESIWLRVDGISLLVAAMALTLGTLVVLFSGPYMAGEVGEEKYYAMLLAMIGLMIGLACADDLFNLWVWFEGMAVSSYLLVAFYREQSASLEAGIKYLVQSAVGSVLALLGISLVLANAGTLNMPEVREAVASLSVNRFALLGAGALFVIGFGVKVAVVPLHTWLPDAHSQAPSGISAMLSGVVIEAGLIAMLRALSVLTGFSNSWGLLFMIFGALNILYGNLLALRQTTIKRLLAYSSLSHIGYILLGLGVAFYSGAALGAQGAFFHFFTHMLMKGLAFLSVGALMYGMFLQNDSHAALKVTDLAGAAQKYPLVALAFSIAVLALGGLPPLAGFMSKWQIFVAGFQVQNNWVTALMIFMALNSVLSLAYYAPLVNLMYRKSPSEQVMAGKPLPLAINLPLLLMMLAVIVLGFVPQLMDWVTVPAAQVFIAMFGG